MIYIRNTRLKAVGAASEAMSNTLCTINIEICPIRHHGTSQLVNAALPHLCPVSGLVNLGSKWRNNDVFIISVIYLYKRLV